MSLDKTNEGRRVKLVYCPDKFTKLVAGDEGTYQYSMKLPSGRRQHSIKWDTGSTLMLIDGIDRFRFLTEAK